MKYLLLALVLTGCAAPVITPTVQKVEVPIAVACTTPTPAPPELCRPSLMAADDIFVKVRCLLSDAKLHEAYEAELAAALASCK